MTLNFLAIFREICGLNWELSFLFSTIYHPQIDGQTEVVNMILSIMLRAVLEKNSKIWEECLPHIKFAYNYLLHCSTKMCPFKIVYGLLPRAPIV
jgi:hypothetical protein